MILRNTFAGTVLCLIVTMSHVPELRSQVLTNSPDYSAGMASYMNGDFESAKQHWLAAVQSSNDAKAMFNLGLLHERKKLVDANDQRAEQWFEQAGNTGYAPADYHLALRLDARGEKPSAGRLLRRAADSGFVLAQERLGSELKGSVPTASINDSSSRETARVANYAIQSSKIKPEGTAISPSLKRTYNRESWLLNQPSGSWTIQMLAFSDEAKVMSFIDNHGLHDNAAYFAQGKEGSVVYKLVYGSYANKQRADQARAKLTPALKDQGPWLRPLNAVQTVIRQR